MEQYKQEFIDFMVESDVLKFGDFHFKKWKKITVFMNAGAYSDRNPADAAWRILCEGNP